MRRICTFVELFKFFLFLFGFAEGSMCVFVNISLIFKQEFLFKKEAKKSHQINFTSLNVNSGFFLSKSHQKNKRVYDDRF